MSKPIRVFWSPLSRRFMATSTYRELKPGVVEVTGKAYDVTNDIARLIDEHSITFTPKSAPTLHDGTPDVGLAGLARLLQKKAEEEG